MNANDFGETLTFHLVPPAGHVFPNSGLHVYVRTGVRTDPHRLGHMVSRVGVSALRPGLKWKLNSTAGLFSGGPDVVFYFYYYQTRFTESMRVTVPQR